VLTSITFCPGRNIKLAGFGVVLVCMNIPRCCICPAPAQNVTTINCTHSGTSTKDIHLLQAFTTNLKQ
jgi:hypothetical protein